MLIGGQTIPNHHDIYDKDEIGKDDLEENLFSNKVWVFDWTIMQWKRMKRLTKGRHSHSCSQTPDKKLVVVAGGLTGIKGPSLTIEVFDVATEEWKLLDSKLPWHVIGVPFIQYGDQKSEIQHSILFRPSITQNFKNDYDDEYDDNSDIETNDKASNDISFLQLSDTGSFKEWSNVTSSPIVKVRPYGVILVVPEVVVCFKP